LKTNKGVTIYDETSAAATAVRTKGDGMAFAKNQFGVPQYPQGDARRLFVLASAIDLLERATATAIADLTGFDKGIVDDEVAKLREQYGMTIHKFGDMYKIESWGDVLNKEGVVRAMKQE
jgi:hypothetical protein